MTDKQQPFKMPEPGLKVLRGPLKGDYFTAEQFADQMQAAYEQGRGDMRDEAARVCENLRDKIISAQEGPSAALANVMLRQVAELGAGECADAIRNLKDTTK